MSDAGKMLVTMMMLGSMIAGNEFRSQPVDFDLMDDDLEKPDTDSKQSEEKERTKMDKKYHVGLGIFGIYAGTLKTKTKWKDKSEVTQEAIDAVAGFLLINKKECRFELQGKKYVMSVTEVEEEEAEVNE